MLALTRRENEEIILTLPNGDIIQFAVIETRSHRVKIGINAPDNVTIDRKEIYEKKLKSSK